MNQATVAALLGDRSEVTARFVRRWGRGEAFGAIGELAELTSAVMVRCLFYGRAEGDGAEIGERSERLLGLFNSPVTILAPWRMPGRPPPRR